MCENVKQENETVKASIYKQEKEKTLPSRDEQPLKDRQGQRMQRKERDRIETVGQIRKAGPSFPYCL